MWDNFIGRQIRRANRNLLLFSVIVALGTGAILWANRGYFYNFFAGPFPSDEKALVALTSTSSLGDIEKSFVKVSGDKKIETGINQIEETRDKYSNAVKSSKVVANYLALKLGDHFLVVMAPTDAAGTVYSGALAPVPDYVKINLIDELEKEAPGVKAAFLPFMVDATGFRGPGYWGLGFAIPILLLCLWSLSKAVRRSINPDEHPIALALAKLGAPEALARQIDDEMRSPADVTRVGSSLMTPSWLFQTSYFGLQMHRIENLIWVHGHVTQHYTNGIKSGKTFKVILRDRFGRQTELTTRKEAQSQALMAQLAARAPWICFGFDDQLAALWATDRAGLIAAVDERRAQTQVKRVARI